MKNTMVASLISQIFPVHGRTAFYMFMKCFAEALAGGIAQPGGNVVDTHPFFQQGFGMLDLLSNNIVLHR